MVKLFFKFKRELTLIVSALGIWFVSQFVALLLDPTTRIFGLEFLLDHADALVTVSIAGLAMWAFIALTHQTLDTELDKGLWKKWWSTQPEDFKLKYTGALCGLVYLSYYFALYLARIS